jgi:UDP-3-O-[3-hydroxymyristoyl] glucosamine N-acyltransferase
LTRLPLDGKQQESVYAVNPSVAPGIASKGWLEMALKLAEIASMVGGRLIGDGDVSCQGANPPEQATKNEITMLDDPRRVDSVVDSEAIAAVTTEPIEIGARAQVIVSDAHRAFATIVAHFRPPIQQNMSCLGLDPTAEVADPALIHPSATIGAGVKIGKRTRILPGVVVMPHCHIGDDCILHANVTLYEHTRIDDRVVIHAGSVIGAHGFGYRQDRGRHVPTAQLGYVAIESDVELGACVTIDRGTYGATRIGQGTKIDNQVMIGHNCQIGRHNLLCSQVGIAGSCRTGDHVILAGQVGLKDHIQLGDHAIVGAQAGVMDDLDGDQVYLGSPATTQREQMQIMAVERRLPEMRRELKQLHRELDQLKSQIRADPDDDSREDRRAA